MKNRQPDPMRWADQANCLGTDPDLFFPERGAPINEAKQVCKGCVVKQECLDYAMENGEKFGVWGGLSERQRRRLRRPVKLDAPTKLIHRGGFSVVEEA